MLSTQALTTVADVKIYLDIDTGDTSQDASIEQLINAVSDDIAQRCNRIFGTVTATEKIVGSGRQYLSLANFPITAVSAVLINDEAIDSSEYDIDAASGQLLRINGIWPTPSSVYQVCYYPMIPEATLRENTPQKRNISVSYTGGYILPWQATHIAPIIVPTLPNDLIMACIKMVASDINRKGSEHESSESLGPLQSSFLSQDYSEAVLGILERYKKPVVL